MTKEEAIEFGKMWLEVFETDKDSHTYEFFDMAIEALEQEPCEDAISRQAVLEIHSKYGEYMGATKFWEFRDSIRELPLVKPQEPKEGHWKIIPFNNNHGEYRPNKYACSECGWEIDLCRGLQQDTGHRLFCEHCGAKMESENARGDKE